MYRKGGIQPFFVGSSATITRDLVFGGVFSLIRHELHQYIEGPRKEHRQPRDNDFTINLLSGCVATILSSPFNYIRNIHYATPPGVPHDKFIVVWMNLWREAQAEGTGLQRLSFILTRLRIGWGAARVGCGMAVGAYLYSLCAHFDSPLKSTRSCT